MPNELEEQAFNLLRRELPGVYVPDREQKRQVRFWLNISDHFRSAFDALILKVSRFQDIEGPSDFVLVEIKVTRKYLPIYLRTHMGFSSA